MPSKNHSEPTVEQMRVDVLRWMGIDPDLVIEEYFTLDRLHGIIRGFTPDEFRIFLGFLANAVYPKRQGKTIPHLMSMDEFQGCWNATEEHVLTAVYQTKKQ